MNEDQPATGRSPRNACLDLVETSDLYIGIIGARGGWTTPSGKLVVQEEFEHARLHKIPTLLFLQDAARDADADTLTRTLSDFIDGAFRRTFSSPAELSRDVEAAVKRETKTMTLPLNSADVVTTRLSARTPSRGDALVRVVIAPERAEEVITPMTIESAKFEKTLYALGHAGDPSLFSYAAPKTSRHKNGVLTVEQSDPNGRHSSAEYVHLSLEENGILVIDASVAPSGEANSFASGMVVYSGDITAALTRIFSFAASLFDHIDPHKRHQRFLYAASLVDLGYRQIRRDRTPSNSFGLTMRSGNGSVAAFDGARPIGRSDLARPEDEIARTVTMLDRAAREGQ